MNVRCSKTEVWASIWLSTEPNLVASDFQDGHKIVQAFIRFDDNAVERTTLSQNKTFLYFVNADWAVDKIKYSKEIEIRLDWHGRKNVVFSYPMGGANSAIAEALTLCGQ